MANITRRDFLEVTGAGLGSLALKGGPMSRAQPPELSGAMAELYRKFLDPDRKYSIRPFWFWNGTVAATPEIAIPHGANEVTLRVSAREVLDCPFAVTVAPTVLSLGTWKVPGLEHFSGTMVYEKTVNVPGSLLTERVLLDCGVVGVCAEAWVNGKHVGKRPWGPYTFDITDQLHAGNNQLKVRVANTEGNARAVGIWRSHLDNIDVDGWHGPGRLVPFVEGEIKCTLI